MTKEISVEYRGSSLILTVSRANSFKAYFLLAFTVFWASGLLLAAGIIPNDWITISNKPSPFEFFLHGMVAVFTALLTARYFFNSVVIDVTDGRLKVVEHPLPIRFAHQRILSANITQLYTIVERGGEHASISGYKVNAIMRNGKTIRVIGGLSSIEMGVEIERRIETHLGIQDRKIKPIELPDYGKLLNRDVAINYGKPDVEPETGS